MVAPEQEVADELDDEPEEDLEDLDGHCVWYGQCGNGWNNGALNCLANNKTRKSPRLTDPEGLRILKKYCTALYKGKTVNCIMYLFHHKQNCYKILVILLIL